MYRLGLCFLAAPLFAQNPGTDIVLLLEKTPGIRQPLPSHQFASIPPDDRVAVMTFGGHSQVRQAFTSDPKKLERALREAERNRALHPWGNRTGTPPQVHVFQSLLDAAQLFNSRPSDPGRGRVILTIFGTEDESVVPPLDEMRQELSSAHIRLYAVAISKFDPLHARDSQIETPPTFPGRTPPVPTDRLPLPEKTLQTLRILAAETSGAVSGEANLPRILHQALSQ